MRNFDPEELDEILTDIRKNEYAFLLKQVTNKSRDSRIHALTSSIVHHNDEGFAVDSIPRPISEFLDELRDLLRKPDRDGPDTFVVLSTLRANVVSRLLRELAARVTPEAAGDKAANEALSRFALDISKWLTELRTIDSVHIPEQP